MTKLSMKQLRDRRNGNAPMVPLEDAEQIMLVQWLALHGIKFFSVPNEAALKSARSRYALMQKLFAMGLLKGAPDLVLITPPPSMNCHVAIEMKRGAPKAGKVSENQRSVHLDMRQDNWGVLVAYGCDDAIKQLTELGYGRK